MQTRILPCGKKRSCWLFAGIWQCRVNVMRYSVNSDHRKWLLFEREELARCGRITRMTVCRFCFHFQNCLWKNSGKPSLRYYSLFFSPHRYAREAFYSTCQGWEADLMVPRSHLWPMQGRQIKSGRLAEERADIMGERQYARGQSDEGHVPCHRRGWQTPLARRNRRRQAPADFSHKQPENTRPVELPCEIHAAH